MPRDASGNYTLPSGNPVVSGTTILANWANDTMPDLGTEMTDSLSRSGQGGMLAPLRFVDGDSVQPAMAFTNETSLGMYRPEAGVIGFAGGSAELARIKIDGNIAVSAAVPTAPEDLTRKDYVDAQIIAGDTFPLRLGGYAITGLHEEYQGDLNDIGVNSSYGILDGTVTNEPADMVGFATIVTDMRFGDGTWSSQTIYGMSGANEYRQWMRSQQATVWGAWKLVVDGGAFPLRLAGYQDNGRHISYAGDLDDIIVNSAYQINATAPNSPADMTNDGILFTDMYSTTDDFGSQIIIGFTGGAIYKQWQRNRNSGIWDAWKLVVDGGAFPLRLAGYEDDGFHSTFTGDADTILIDSTYAADNQVITNGPPDASSWGFITTELLGDDSNFARQTFSGFVSSLEKYKVWSRSKSTIWNPWILVVDGGAFTTRYAGLRDTGYSDGLGTADLDTVLNNSRYNFNSANTPNSPTDMAGFGFLETYLGGDASGGVQVIYGQTGTSIGKQWMRPRSSNIWGAWKLVVDGGAFTERLAGYEDDGFHENYAGDINLIDANSCYRIQGSQVTNEPADYAASGWGFLVSYQFSATNSTQIIYGMDDTNVYRQWMRRRDGGGFQPWLLVVDGIAQTMTRTADRLDIYSVPVV